MSSMKFKLRLIGAFAALAALALAVSCTGFFVNPTLTSLAIGPANLSLAPATSYQMVATGTYSDGSTRTVTGQCVWTSSSQSVAAFSPSVIGQLTAASLQNLVTLPGTTSVSASDGTVSSSSQTVTVCPVVEKLTITVNGGPSATVSNTSATVTFDATATFNGVTGTTDVTGNVTWNIGSTAVLSSIDSSGNGTLAGSGTTNVSATLCGTTSNSVSLTVD
jgi:hypothetical protein